MILRLVEHAPDELPAPDGPRRWIALTSHACHTLDATDIPYEPLGAHATDYAVNRFEREACGSLTGLLERLDDGAGVLPLYAYAIHLFVTASLYRAHALGQLAHALKPEAMEAPSRCHEPIGIYGGPLDKAYTAMAGPVCEALGSRLIAMPADDLEYNTTPPPRPAPAARPLAAKVRKALERAAGSARSIGTRKTNRVLGVNLGSDWNSVEPDLRARGFDIRRVTVEGDYCFGRLSPNPTSDAGPAPALNPAPAAPTVIEGLGIDIAPAVDAYLQAHASSMSRTVHENTAAAEALLDEACPSIALFHSISTPEEQTLARQCRRRNLPVVSWQHGGSYGTHDCPSHDLTDYREADYFLTYGRDTAAPKNPVAPTAARVVPTGSARLATIRRYAPARGDHGQGAPVLWLDEVSFRNTIGGPFTHEETTHYARATRALAKLDEHGVDVTYRPYPNQPWNGVARWVAQRPGGHITHDEHTPLELLWPNHGLAVITCASSTCWLEAFAAGIPIVLFCDTDQVLLDGAFERTLEEACLLYRDDAAFADAMTRLSEDPTEFVREAGARDPGPFIERYLSGLEDPTGRVVDFLTRLAQDGSAA